MSFQGFKPKADPHWRRDRQGDSDRDGADGRPQKIAVFKLSIDVSQASNGLDCGQ